MKHNWLFLLSSIVIWGSSFGMKRPSAACPNSPKRTKASLHKSIFEAQVPQAAREKIDHALAKAKDLESAIKLIKENPQIALFLTTSYDFNDYLIQKLTQRFPNTNDSIISTQVFAAITLATPSAGKWLKSRQMLIPKFSETLAIYLFLAAQHRDYAMANFITTYFPEVVNAINENEASPLIVAIFEDDVPMIDLLLKVPAIGINQEGGYGSSPLQIAVSTGKPNAVLVVKKLLAMPGIEINHQDEFLATALIGAVLNGSLEIVQMLMEANADPTLKDDEEKTALNYAQESASPDKNKIIQALTPEKIKKEQAEQGE